MKIHKQTHTYELDELRFVVKKMANILQSKNQHYGAFPMKRITDEVLEGTVKYHDLNRWYFRAVKKLNAKR